MNLSGRRLTCVIPGLACGGAERVMVNLTARLSGLGHGVTLLTLDPAADDFFAVADSVHRRRLPETVPTRCRWFDLRCQQERTVGLRAALLDTRPELVISFLDTTNIAVLLALRGSGVPVVVAEHSDPRRHVIGWRWSLLRRLIYPSAARVVVLNASIEAWAARQWPSWRLALIPNAIETPPAAPVRPASFGRHNLVAMGRLGPEKGFDLLLAAFARVAERFPDWQLSVFGEGQERAALERQTGTLGLERRVRFPGRSHQPQAVFAAADLFIMSSRYEGFPMTLLEAMAAGLPVVSFDCPSGPGSIIRPGIDGLLVPPEDVEALAVALARLMGDAAERRRLGAGATQISERFGPERITGLWQTLIDEVLGLPAVPARGAES